MASNRKLLLLCAFIVGAVAAPASQREQCARYCTEESDFSLRPGSTYTYDYETTTTTAVQGSSQDQTQVQLTAQVDIEVLSKCDLALRLRGVTLKLSDPESPEYLNAINGARDFARSVEGNILKFSFQNGKVEHICPTENVPAWVTNIHKGVLSAFQTYMLQPDWSTKVTEIDVLGKCQAEYQSLGRSWQGTHTIRKIKDLSTCTDRENVETYLQGTPYAQNFQTKSLPLVKATQECEQVLGQGYLQSSTCREKLFFRPFANGGSSVVTNVVQKLSYATVSKRTFTGNDYRPTTESLLFRHAAPEENPARRVEDAESALKELCDASQNDISITVPRIFSAFVYKLKKLPLADLRSFYQKVETICPSNTKARKFFMDAIPIVATTDSAKFMYDMISRKVISDAETDFWLTSLSFVNEPTADIIAAFTPLLDGAHEQALLGVSALMHTLCKSNDCSKIPEVERATQKLFTNLGENCFNSNDKKVIMTLKSLSNVGIMFGKENILQACYKNPQIRMEARLAAIQAYRRVTCDISRQDLMQMYSNYNEDPEVRIASYLAVMTCPSAGTVDAVKEVLMKEKINHVGSFIWTHLNALSKTKHPQRQDIRDIVSNLYLLNKYNSDARKFSTAAEAHFYLESLDSGFHVDSHLVFSTDSYLPRTAMFNLTVDVFGKTCNLFQIDGRMEGLEHVVESFFGPSGYFPQKNIAKILREKRSASNNKIQDMDTKFQAKSRFQQTPYGSLDVKIFGTTLWYDQFKESDDGTPDINLLEVVTKLAEEHEAEYSRSFMFMDTTFTVPMTSGMPLRIAVNGTASVGLKYGGKFDVKSFEHVDVLGHIEPSGAIEIASLLTVDAGNAVRSGLRVVGTMHSSTVLDGRVEVRNGEVIKAQLNMPRDRIDIFNVQSKMYLIHGPEEREQKVDKKGETNMKTCSGDTTKKLFGVQLCSELRLPPYKPNSALHPINGPAHFNVYIQKTDPKLKSYTFDAEWKLEMKNGALVRHGHVSLNTPDSQVDRDVKMELYINHADHTATFKVKTPVKRFGATAKMVNDEALKKLNLQLSMDDKDYFSLQTELKTISDKSSVTFMPSLEIRIPSRRVAAISGSAYIKSGQKYTAQLQIEDLTEKPILAKGNLEVGKRDRYDGEFSINSFAIDGIVKCYAQLGDSMASRLTAEYKFLEGKMNKISIMGKMRNLSANALVKYTGLLNMQASLLPEWTTELAFETMTTTGHIENTVSLSLGDGVRSQVRTIRMQKILKYEGNLKNNKVDCRLSLADSERNINYGIQVNHENTENSLKNTLKVQYDTNQNIVTEVQLSVNKNAAFSVSGGAKLKYPGRDAAVSLNLSETSPKEYTGTMTCQWREGRQASFIVNYRDKTDSTRIKYELEGEMNLPLRTPITFSSTIGSQQGQFAGFAEMNMGMDKYRAQVDYTKGNGVNHRASGQLILSNQIYGLEAALQQAKSKLSCNVEVKMPNRQRITAKLEGRTGDSLREGIFETLWDADRDTSKRFGINGGLRNHADGYEGKVIVQIRRRTVTGLMSTSMKGEFLSSSWNTNNKIELEWSPSEKATAVISSNILLDRTRQQVSSQLEITTPYYNYENLSLSLTHMYANQQWESELSTILPQKNQIFISTSGKYSFVRGGATVETRAKLQTSFDQLSEINFDLSHDHNSKELTSKVQANWGSGKRVALDVSGVIQPFVYKGSLKFTSPFRNFEDLSAEIVHNNVPENYRTRCELQWAPRRKVTVNFEGKYIFDGRHICTIAITASSPFRDFENTAAKLTYSNNESAFNTDVELSWSNRKKITSSFTGSIRKSPYTRNIESKFLFTTPFRNYEDFQISTALETNRNSYKVNVDAQLPHRSTASFNSQGKITSLSDIELNAVVIGHFPKYMQPQSVSIDFAHNVQSTKLRSSLDTAYNNNRLTLLAIGLAESGYDSRNIEFSASMNSPFHGYEEIKCDFSHQQKGNEWLTKIQSNKNKISGSFTHKLVIPDMLNFETTLEATSSEFNDVKVSVIQVHNKGQLEHNSYVTWDRKGINFNAQYLDRSFTKEFSLTLTTPFRKVRQFEVKSSYEYQNWDHKASLSVVMDRKHKAALSGNIRNYRWKNVDAKLELTSSYNGYEFYSGAFNYDLTAPQKSLEMSYLWDVNSRKAITLKANLLHSYSLTNIEVEATSPYRDFKQITFSTKFENSSPETNLNVLYERDSHRIVFNGKTIVQNHRAQVNFDFSTPYQQIRSLKFIAKYDRLSEGMIGEIIADWNKISKYQVKGEYKLQNRAAEGKLSLLTPFEGFRKVDIQSNINYGSSRQVVELSVKWENDKIVLINGEFITRRDGHGVNVNIQTSFDNYEDISYNAWYKAITGAYEGEIKAVLSKNKVYESNGALTFGGEHLMDLKFNINLPTSQFRNLKLTTSIDSETGFQQITSVLLLNGKESQFKAFFKRDKNQFFEVDAKLETPYKNIRYFNFESSLRRENNQFIDARLKMTTPFELLRTLDAYSEIRVDDSGCQVVFSLSTPQQKIKLEGKVSNRQFRPFTAVFEIDAPFLSFKKLSTSADINLVSWSNAKMSFKASSPRFNHELVTLFLKDDDDMEFQIKVESSALKSRAAIFTVKADYDEMNKIDAETSLQMLGNVHYLKGQLVNTGRSMEIEAKLESPLLPEGKAEVGATVSKRRRSSTKTYEGKLSFTVPSSTHEISMKYEGKDSQIVSSIKIDSNLLNSSPVEAQAKYTNGNNRDLEASFIVSSSEATHTVVGSLKNYENEKFFQFKIECPMVEFLNTFSVTGTLKHNNFETMDGSLSVGARGKELRIAGNMKNEGWKNVEAFVTLNTPFDALPMLRVDGRFRNDRFQDIDCNFQVETSNRNLHSLGMTSKISRTKGSEEISLMLHLPLRNYRTVQILANAHYEADFSSADSRITLTLPPQRYSISGQYGISGRISGTGELEINGDKWIAAGRLERTSEINDATFSFTTPSSDRYNFGAAYGKSGKRQFVAGSYINPSNEKYDVNTSLSFDDYKNFEASVRVETPFNNYRNIEASVNQQYNSNYLSTNVEYLKNGKRGFLRILHRISRNLVTGYVQMGCPYVKLRDVKLAYNHQKKPRDQECSLELDWNKVKQFKAELLQFGDKSAHVILDVPVLPMTLTADSKVQSNGRELNVKTQYNSRVVGFRTSYTREMRQLSHDASFTWDEKADKRVSYDFKLTDTATGKELWSRLDMPIRSFMLKGNFTNSNRVTSGGFDFYWDASRSLEKHMALGLEHTDMSHGRQTSQRVQIKAEHPKLSRDIIQTNTITFGPNEFHVKSELVYSRQRHHHLLMELRANDLSRSNRDSHYKCEFTLRHPATKLDVRGNGEVMNSKLESSLAFKINTVDKTQVQHVHEAKASLSKIMQEIDISMRSDEDLRKIMGSVTNKNGEMVIFIEVKKNELKELSTLLKVNNRNKSSEFTIMNAENTGVHASASYSKEFATLKLSHSNKDNAITDLNVFVGLEQSRILKSQLNWRPRMWEELRITTGENLRAFIRSTKNTYTSVSQEVAEDLGQRLSLMSKYAYEQVTSFADEISGDLAEMKRDLKNIKSAFQRMYRNNEFCMQDIVHSFGDTCAFAREFMDGMSLGFEVLGNIIIEYYEELYYSAYYGYLDMIEYLEKEYAQTMQSLSASMTKMRKSIAKCFQIYTKKLQSGLTFVWKKIQGLSSGITVTIDKWVRAYAPILIDSYFYLKNAADTVRETMEDFYGAVYECLESNKYYTALKNYVASIAETVQAFRQYEYTETAQAFFNRIYDAQIIDSIINHPNVEYMSDLANNALLKSVQIYHNLGLDMVVASISESITNYAKEMVLNAAQELLSDMYQLKGGAKYEFAPHRGFMAFEMTLPAPRNSLVEVFDFKSYPEYQKIVDLKTTLSAEYYEDFCIWDYYYKFLKYFSPGYWLPTFTGHAMISGNQHYITFDKLSYDYAGKCSYLLARDFVDGNFSIIVNYGEDHIRKSLTVLSEGKKIDIGHDYKITVDDTKTESPVQVGPTVVMREGANIRIENDKKGFYIVCNFVYNYCSVSLSGFYYAKTGGLFGTFNYEPKLDMMTPTRHMANDLESFASSWEVSQRTCRSTENLATVPGNDYRVHEKCKNLFSKSSSEFRACFKQVDPQPYLTMCISDLSAVHHRNLDDAICEAAAAYFLQCKLGGVPLKMPSKCVRCEKQDGSMMAEGESLKFTRDDIITAADVVFLIEEKECNKDRVKYLGKLAQSIEENYKHNGYRNVRFSVVAFGGDEIHSAPHVHTMDGQISGPLRSLQSALDSLQFGDGPINILEALRYAASLNFRPGTTKSFVLMKCSTCKSEEVKAEYSEILRTLIDGDVSLHLLMEQRYEMKIPNKNAKARKVIGVDKTFAYTLKDVKDSRLSGDGDLLAQLRIPKDVCIPLAFEVNGSTFDVQFLFDTRKNTNKKFIDVMSRRVVRSASRPSSEWGMCCECIATVDGVGRSTCQKCVSAEIASMISAETSGVNMIPINAEIDVSKRRVRKHKDRKNKE